VQKAGSTSLHFYMSQHPQLQPPRRKELHFFDDDSLDWVAPPYDLIEQKFPPNPRRKKRFDVTPIYIFWPDAVRRIRDYNSSARLILLFRDPFERAWSHWCMEFARGRETLPFADAIRGGRSRLDGLSAFARKRRIWSYVERGFYGRQLEQVLQCFPREQLLLLKSSEFRLDPLPVLNKVSKFAGVADFRATDYKHYNQTPKIQYPAHPTEADRLYLKEILHDDLLLFQRLSGFDIADWPIIA
jgi:hypothetical protein